MKRILSAPNSFWTQGDRITYAFAYGFLHRPAEWGWLAPHLCSVASRWKRPNRK